MILKEQFCVSGKRSRFTPRWIVNKLKQLSLRNKRIRKLKWPRRGTKKSNAKSRWSRKRCYWLKAKRAIKSTAKINN